jgi:potassium/chloride transporter 4/5/6
MSTHSTQSSPEKGGGHYQMATVGSGVDDLEGNMSGDFSTAEDMFKDNPLFNTLDKGTTGLSEMIGSHKRGPAKSITSIGGEGPLIAEPRLEEKLGLIKGVYLPTTQNILGVILFLRLPWIVANAGIILTTVIIFLCVGSTALTSMSLSAIATNGKIHAGGPYYVISRNLGVEIGGAVGMIFWLGTTLAATMYALGAIESLQQGFGLAGKFYFDLQVEAILLVGMQSLVVLVGVKYVNLSANMFLFVVFLSIFAALLGASLFAGGVWQGDVSDGADVAGDNWSPNYEKDEETGVTPDFFFLVALFYPSVTGIMAGSNRSGLLLDPGRHIPAGTIGAITTTTLIYLVVVWLIGNVLSNEYLKDDKLAIASIAWPPLLVNIGIVLSSMGAGMQSLVGAPRLLAAIANDGVIPFLNVFACPSDATPTNAILFTGFICMLPCLAGNLDFVTPFVTMFFLMMYSTVNFACFMLVATKSPGFRPMFKYYSWQASLLGTVWCLTLMLLISWYISIVCWFLAACLFLYIKSKRAEREWGDIASGLKFQMSRNFLSSMKTTQLAHAKTWRPQIVCRVDVDKTGKPTDMRLLRFVSQLKKGRGLSMFVGMMRGDVTTDARLAAPAELVLKDILKAEKVDHAFSRVIVTDEPDDAFHITFQAIGLGALRPNTVFLEWKEDWDTDTEGTIKYMRQMQAVLSCEKALVVLRDVNDQLPTEQHPVVKGFIDVWWIVHDGGLLILLPYLLKLNKIWHACEVRLFGVVMNPAQKASVEENIESYLERLRIVATVLVVDMSASVAEPVSKDKVERRDSAIKIRGQSVRDLGSQIANTLLPQDDDSKIKQPTEVKRHKRRVSYTKRAEKEDEAALAASSLNAQIRTLSSDATLVLTNFPVMNGVDTVDFMSYCEILTSGIPPCLLVRGSGYDVMTADG